ncbi:amidohydrolase family protein [Haloarcula pelagica]|uniref:amidohydrolase family protein n=2 Tax=Haloarcula TaxID=2237 RepID=UPI0024C46757|nr:amidohydrolase family protein [Halomicroarcula sp. YJ-61-S]
MAHQSDSLAERSDQARQNPLADQLADVPVIDMDVHTSFRHEAIQRDMLDHLDDPYRQEVEYYLQPDTSSYDGLYPTDNYNRDLNGKLPTELMQVTDPQEDIDDVLSNEFHVDYPIVNMLPELNMVRQTDKAVAFNRAANNVLIERFLDGQENFRGLASVVPHDPAASAEEIDRVAKEDQICGVFLNSTGVKTPLGDQRYDPIYRAAEDNDLPVVYHGAAAPGLALDFPIIQHEMQTYMANHALGHVYSQMLTLTSLFENGTPAKFPDLEFVFQEAGIAWLSLIFRLNREYKQRRSEVPLLEKTPEQYVRDQFYFATQPLDEPDDSTMMKQLIEMWGPDVLMFATDHPHFDIDNTEALLKYLGDFTEEERNKVLYKNSADVFDIDVEA